jgi:hypothetical protein
MNRRDAETLRKTQEKTGRTPREQRTLSRVFPEFSRAGRPVEKGPLKINDFSEVAGETRRHRENLKNGLAGQERAPRLPVILRSQRWQRPQRKRLAGLKSLESLWLPR